MTYQVCVSWELSDILEIEANSLEKAIELAHELPLPQGEYVDGSFEVNHDATYEINHDLLPEDEEDIT